MSPFARWTGIALVTAASFVPASAVAQQGKTKPEDMGRELRMMALSRPVKEWNIASTPEFPSVMAVLMDWPLDAQIATVLASSEGEASLYTTSTFGIIGGGGSAPARTAAQRAVRMSQSHYAGATPATTFPYPARNRVRFWFIGYQGVRTIEADLDEVMDGKAATAPLGAAMQDLLTEMLKMAPR